MKKPRVVPIVPALRPHLKEHAAGNHVRRGEIGLQACAGRRIGMAHIHFHDLRHSSASILLGVGVDLYTIGKILGHSNIQSERERYAHLQVDQQRKALEKLRRPGGASEEAAKARRVIYTQNYTGLKSKTAREGRKCSIYRSEKSWWAIHGSNM